MTFDEWWSLFIVHAVEQKNIWIVDGERKESYREYFMDGDTPEDAFFAEMKRVRKFY